MLMKTHLERQSGGTAKYLDYFTMQPGLDGINGFMDSMSLQGWRRRKPYDNDSDDDDDDNNDDDGRILIKWFFIDVFKL